MEWISLILTIIVIAAALWLIDYVLNELPDNPATKVIKFVAMAIATIIAVYAVAYMFQPLPGPVVS